MKQKTRYEREIMHEIDLVHQETADGKPRVIVYRRRRVEGRKKKGSQGLRVIERAVDQLARATQSFSSTYEQGHRSANRKKKDGWARDLNDNLYRAARNANKKIDVLSIFGL
jgi:hypothetical protein